MHLSWDIGKVVKMIFFKRKNLEPRKSELLAVASLCRLLVMTKSFHFTWSHCVLTKPEVSCPLHL